MSIRLVLKPVIFMNIPGKFSKMLTTAYIGENSYEPLPANQPRQEETNHNNHNGRDVKHQAQVAELDNAKVSKTPSSRGSTDLSLATKFRRDSSGAAQTGCTT